MEFAKQISDADNDFAAFRYMTMMLGKQHAIFGPNPEDIREFETLKKTIALASTQASGLKAFIVGERNVHVETLNNAPDGPEILQVTAGMVFALNERLKQNVRSISNKHFPAGQIKQINKEVEALNNILMKAYDALMELRQSVLAKKGLAPHFRATRSNLEKIAVDACRTEVGEQDFVEV